jgi:hypothetical protein
MTVDQAMTAWESMLTDANGTAAAAARPTTVRGYAIVAFRTAVLLILAALAILVLLPAALAAQAVSG